MTTPDEVAALVKQARSYLASCAPHILERTGHQYLVKTVTALESLSPPAGMVMVPIPVGVSKLGLRAIQLAYDSDTAQHQAFMAMSNGVLSARERKE